MKIRNAKGRKDGNSGYTRVFGNDDLGKLISKVQSTVISNGAELERIILKSSNQIENLDDFINDVTYGNTEDGVFVCSKSILKKSQYACAGIEPDLLIFIVERRRICKVIELKDGDTFDTKKSQGEKEHLEMFSTNFGAKIPFVTEYYMCSFNQLDKESIKIGFKNIFDIKHIMTGKELCEILDIDYEKIVTNREKDMEDNLDYFIDQLLNISEVREIIQKKLK